VRSYSIYSNVPSALFDNAYEEVGNCTNPLGTGIAGLIVLGGYAQVSGGTGPAGAFPQYAATGNTQYNYYVVVHSSTLGVSPAFLAGTALTNGAGNIPVLWNQAGRQGVITYDILRTTGDLGIDTVAPYGTGNFSIAVGITTANCSNQVCSFLDDAASNPGVYTVDADPLYSPSLRNWPGAVILTQIEDLANTGGFVPTRYYAQTILGGGFVVSGGSSQPSVFAQECDPVGDWSSIWRQCLGGNAISNDNPSVVATLLQLSANGGAPGGLKRQACVRADAEQLPWSYPCHHPVRF
jgi:hypothetical protein